MLTRRNLHLVAALGLVLAIVAGCGSSSDDDASSSSVTKAGATPLEGTLWLLADSTSLGVTTANVTVTAEFKERQVSGTSGCNTYNTSYELTGNQLTISPEIVSTRIACEPGPTAVEQAYLARLPKVQSYKIEGNQLALLDAGKQELLVYEASNDTSGILGEWTVTTYYTGTAVQSVLEGSTMTADFEDGEVTGDGGCNTFGGPYRLDGDTIDMGPFRSTLKACATPELQAQEQHYLSALELATTWRISGNSLGLVRKDGGVAATFDRG